MKRETKGARGCLVHSSICLSVHLSTHPTKMYEHLESGVPGIQGFAPHPSQRLSSKYLLNLPRLFPLRLPGSGPIPCHLDSGLRLFLLASSSMQVQPLGLRNSREPSSHLLFRSGTVGRLLAVGILGAGQGKGLKIPLPNLPSSCASSPGKVSAGPGVCRSLLLKSSKKKRMPLGLWVQPPLLVRPTSLPIFQRSVEICFSAGAS